MATVRRALMDTVDCAFNYNVRAAMLRQRLIFAP